MPSSSQRIDASDEENNLQYANRNSKSRLMTKNDEFVDYESTIKNNPFDSSKNFNR